MAGPPLSTEAAASKLSQQQQLSTNRPSVPAPSSSNPPARPLQSTTPIPVPLPITSISREQPQPQQQPQIPSRSSSPVRPTYSPITPPLKATTFPPRPTHTHSSHVDATAAPAPAPAPIDFDSNPDVLALKSAISILQMQRRKAEKDMATLDRVKRTALAEPEAFVRDLTAGRIHVEGENPFASSAKDEDSDSNDEDDNDGDDSIQKKKDAKHFPAQPEMASASEKPSTKAVPQWVSIPKPQNIVRCPPINWSQYAVVGESLDKLHNEQVQRPAQGAPAVLTPDGRFEFKGGGDGKQERYIGVAAPYAPGKDKIDAKSGTTPLKR
ncbi:hypothetical protein F5B22DRAFT_404465 [Xylaria bambusicola]|uniref:uncharacterized protein n=1 Tax=Xylaria bambusicola TaxID=326684 RepID=UPI0020086C11|nr:uncharacterized protein F5B22DRAFT_404465 [Xylaria bambusicola]KAI0508403.1 hypothetical protein F5B22DRAFT_404465 [Xylaria bambusicola]